MKHSFKVTLYTDPVTVNFVCKHCGFRVSIYRRAWAVLVGKKDTDAVAIHKISRLMDDIPACPGPESANPIVQARPVMW